jgi:tetratricopeptide (TPR) repeat protein
MLYLLYENEVKGANITMTEKLSIAIDEIVSLSKEMKYDRALLLANQKVMEIQSYSQLKQLAKSIKEEDLLPLLRLLDASLLSRFSSLLVKMVNRYTKSTFTQVLQCHELNYSGKFLEADEQLKEMIKTRQSSLDKKVLERAYWALAHALMEMKRFGEAFQYMKLLEETTTEPLFDRWGSYYYQKGEWETAKQYFLQGIEEDPKPQYCYSLLQALYLSEGKTEEALEIIEKGIAHVPYYLPLRLEKAKRLKELEKKDEFLHEISQLEQITPFHDYKHYFQYTRAQIYYHNEDYQAFEEIVSKQPKLFKHTYQVCDTYDQNKIVLLPTNVVVQKYNFCVPATISMLLARYGIVKDQEVIADSIFRINGSRLSVAIEYLKKLQMTEQYFFGTVENYQALTDSGVSIIVCLDYPNSSHVQLVKGYDDNLKAFYLQDPNFPEPFAITYSEFEKHYGNNQCLSIAIIPNEEVMKLSSLNRAEDELVQKIYEFSDRLEMNEETAVKEFEAFAENEQSLYAMSYVVKFYSKKDFEIDLLMKTAQKILETQPDSDYFKLIIAYAYARANNYDGAKAILSDVKNKHVHLYHFLLGRMAYDHEQYLEASAHFYEALKVENDHYDTWSYLSLCSYYGGDTEKAILYSEISLDINRHDIWNRMNYGYILFSEEQYQEAKNLYSELLKEEKRHGHAWYERARCEEKLGRIHQALRGFQVAKQLDPHIPFPYVEIASIYAYAYDDYEKAIAEINDGLCNSNETDFSLLMTLCDFYIAQDKHNEAKACYEKVIEHHGDEAAPILEYTKVVNELEGAEVAICFLKEATEKFLTNAVFLIDAGEWLMHHSLVEEDEELALQWLEAGLSQAPPNLEYSWNLYVNLVENTAFNERGRLFLESQLENEYPGDTNLICYIGCLYETDGQLDVAEQWFRKVLDDQGSTFPLYRLGEMSFNQENYETAKPFYEKCIQVDEAFTVAHMRLAYIEQVANNPEKEHYYLFLAFKQCPDDLDIEYFLESSDQVGKLSDVEEYLETIQGKVEEVWRLQTLAFIAEVQEDLNREATLIEEALAIDPEQEGLLQHYANVCFKQERYEQAIELCLQLIKTDLENEHLYNILIGSVIDSKQVSVCKELLFDLQLTDEDKSIVMMHAANALVRFLAAIKDDIASSKALFKSFITKKQIKLLEPKIIELFKLSYELNPHNGVGINWLCEYHCQHGGGIEVAKDELQHYLQKGWNFDLAFYLGYFTLEHCEPSNTELYEQAIDLLTRCLAEGKELAAIHNNLGQFYLNLGKFENSIYHLDQAIANDPHLCNPYYLKSCLYQQLGDYEKMEEWADKAIQVDPEYIDAYTQLSIAVHLQGRTEEALHYTDQLLDLDEDNVNGHYNKACFLSAIGHVEEAFEHLQFALMNEFEDRYYRNLAETDPDLEPLKTNPLTVKKVRKLLK